MEKYKFLSKLGDGSYGTVWKCANTETGGYVAVKRMKDLPQNSEVSCIG